MNINKLSVALIKSGVNHVVKKNVIIIKAENEDLALQDVAKGVMFKLKKYLDKELKALSKVIKTKSYESKIRPYNTGYELKVEWKIDWRALSEDMGKTLIPIEWTSLYIYAESFIQENIEEGKPGRISFGNFKEKGKKESDNATVKNKKDIKKAVDKFYKENMDRIKRFVKTVRDLSNKEKSQKAKGK